MLEKILAALKLLQQETAAGRKEISTIKAALERLMGDAPARKPRAIIPAAADVGQPVVRFKRDGSPRGKPGRKPKAAPTIDGVAAGVE